MGLDPIGLGGHGQVRKDIESGVFFPFIGIINPVELPRLFVLRN